MSVNTHQLFVRARDLDAVVEYVVSYLQKYVAHFGTAGTKSGTLIDAEGHRSLFILPPVRGWITIMEEDYREGDASLAGNLSKTFQCRAIILKVEGCVFNYQWMWLESGDMRCVETLLSDHERGSTILPRFQDAEVLAWEGVHQRWGVPKEVLFLRPRDLQRGEEGMSPEAVHIQIANIADGFRIQAYKFPIRMPLEPTQPRVHLDAVVQNEADGKVLLAIEQRFLWGDAEPAAVEQLEALLRRIQRRYSRATGLPLEAIRFTVCSGKDNSDSVSLADDLSTGHGTIGTTDVPQPPMPPAQDSHAEEKPKAPPKDPFAF